MPDLHRKDMGTRAVGAVLGALLKTGSIVLIPMGDNERYDLVVDYKGSFKRIQVKHGNLRDGVVKFSTASTNYVNGKWVSNHYRGDIEFFGVFCPDIDKVYLVPVSDVPNRTGSLRVRETKNKQDKKIRWAKDYDIASVTQWLE